MTNWYQKGVEDGRAVAATAQSLGDWKPIGDVVPITDDIGDHRDADAYRRGFAIGQRSAEVHDYLHTYEDWHRMAIDAHMRSVDRRNKARGLDPLTLFIYILIAAMIVAVLLGIAYAISLINVGWVRLV